MKTSLLKHENSDFLVNMMFSKILQLSVGIKLSNSSPALINLEHWKIGLILHNLTLTIQDSYGKTGGQCDTKDRVRLFPLMLSL